MDREILFRGKSIKDDRWYYGYYLYDERVDRAYIQYEASDHMLSVEILPNTVGQWTGKVDKNDEKIFENQVFDIGQTVNGQSQFYIKSCIGGWDIRYAFNDSRYEYDTVGFMHDCNEEFEIVKEQ